MDFELLTDASNPDSHACAGKSVNPITCRLHRRKRQSEFTLIPKWNTGLIPDFDGNRHVLKKNSGVPNHGILSRPPRVRVEIKDVVVKNPLTWRAVVNTIPD